MAVSSEKSTVMTYKGRHWTVGAMVVASIVIAGVVTATLQRWAYQVPVKWDLTSSGINSLSSGTQAVLGSLDEERIYLTSLYMETDIEGEAQKKYRRAVDDLLRLYQAEQPAKIEINWINPLKDQPKLSELLQRVRQREGFKTETKAYLEAIDRFGGEIFQPFKAAVQGFVGELNVIDQSVVMTGGPPPSAGIARALTSWIDLGERVVEDIEAITSQPLPRYSLATQSIQTFYGTVGSKIDLVVSSYVDQQLQSDKLSGEVKTVLARMKEELHPWVDRIKQEQDRVDNLPALEIDKLERALSQSNAVVVESNEGAKAISFEELWPPLREGDFVGPNDFDKRRFAGEGAVTPAILQMIQKEKTALVFVRHAGAKLFGVSGFGPTASRGELTGLKTELEKFNYLVTEWDIKQSQRKPTFDVEPKRTIYIVLRPGPSMSPQGMPIGPNLGPLERAAVINAIGESGRAIFFSGWAIFSPEYEYRQYLRKKWGIDVDGSTMIVSTVPIGPGKWGLAENFASVSSLKFREHKLTEGLEYMQDQCVLPLCTTMKLTQESPEDVTIEELAFVEPSEDLWAVKDPQAFVSRYRDERWTFKTPDDLSGPFPIALASSKGEDKVVVLAVGESMISDAIAMRSVLVRGANNQLQVRRQAPGNMSFFVNILHYLDDTLQWVNVGSPIDTSRIAITERQLAFWRILAVGVLPALALVGGGCVWYVRRR